MERPYMQKEFHMNSPKWLLKRSPVSLCRPAYSVFCLSWPGLVFISRFCSALLPALARSLLRFSRHLICRILFSLRISSNFSQDIVPLSRFLCDLFFSASFSLNVGSVFALCARYCLIFSAARFLFSLTAWRDQKGNITMLSALKGTLQRLFLKGRDDSATQISVSLRETLSSIEPALLVVELNCFPL